MYHHKTLPFSPDVPLERRQKPVWEKAHLSKTAVDINAGHAEPKHVAVAVESKQEHTTLRKWKEKRKREKADAACKNTEDCNYVGIEDMDNEQRSNYPRKRRPKQCTVTVSLANTQTRADHFAKEKGESSSSAIPGDSWHIGWERSSEGRGEKGGLRLVM